MKQRPLEETDRLMTEEKRMAARELIAEAWEEGAQAGIEPDFLAEEMVHAVVMELVNTRGLEEATRLAERIAQKVDEGRLFAPHYLQ